ncbi:MAG TPA: NAD(P)/FAD-dependent oxidoreductase [Chitinophagaceae bacterium]|nr:NAD(P)/FAD-dependent oxidoreductase [Chitinophagaceae bacterium]
MEILVLGAGASGLFAARELARSGWKVTVVEARDRVGGRIHTLPRGIFSVPAEAGAEFVHGDLPLTLSLLKEAGIPFQESAGKFWQSSSPSPQPGEGESHWAEWETRLKKLERDLTVAQFLQAHFGGSSYKELRRSIKGFVSGFDTADPDRASTFSLRQEWLAREDSGPQYRISGGYGRLMDWLAAQLLEQDATICLGCPIREVRWEPGKVTLVGEGRRNFSGPRLLVTLPAGILGAHGKFRFIPELKKLGQGLEKIGFGSVIKVLLEFTRPFWQEPAWYERAGSPAQGLGMFFSEQRIPTWWTQYPAPSSLLTGWLGGPGAASLSQKRMGSSDLISLSLQSLSEIFRSDENELRSLLRAGLAVDWTRDPYCLGSYSYDTANNGEARKTIAEPVEQTLFFAGEATWEGSSMGTVEAALQSGLRAAGQLAVFR